jgi:hypothetical protein
MQGRVSPEVRVSQHAVGPASRPICGTAMHSAFMLGPWPWEGGWPAGPASDRDKDWLCLLLEIQPAVKSSSNSDKAGPTACFLSVIWQIFQARRERQRAGSAFGRGTQSGARGGRGGRRGATPTSD